jgi:hypothetical protein
MQLNVYEYDDLCLADQLQLTWSVGIHLATVDTNEKIYLLFSVFDYYVELVAVHRYEEFIIVEATAFGNGKRLDKYLAEIDLVDLFTY